jgi:hypothetical protein
MSLDDLVAKEGYRDGHRHREREASRSPYRERRDSRGGRDFGRDSGRDSHRDFGKGKGKRRIAPEDKALSNTRCFFNSEGELVVRLYDTEVFTAKKMLAAEKPPEVGSIPSDTKQASEEKSAHGDSNQMSDAAPQEGATVPTDGKPATPQEESTTPAAEPALPQEGADGKPPAPDGNAPAAPAGLESVAASADATPDSPVVTSADSAARSGEKQPSQEDGAAAGTGSAPVTEENVGEPGKEAAPEEAAPVADAKPPVAQDSTAIAADKPDTPASDKPANQENVAAAAPQEDKGGIVVVLNSGKFRTVETKYIINEAANPLSIRIQNSDTHQWTVVGDGVEGEKPFEDRMELRLKSDPARLDAVKQRMDTLISESKDRERHVRRRGDYDAHREYSMPSAAPGWRPGMPPVHPWPHGPPPPGWHGAPPGSWGGHPHHPGMPAPHGAPWDPRGSPHHRAPVYGAPPVAPAPAPRGPLPDSMFQ